MKDKLWIAAIVLLGVPLVMGLQRTQSGDAIQPYAVTTPQSLWTNLGTITDTNATLDVTDRDYSAVWDDLTDANTIKWTVPNDVTRVEFCFECTGDANAYVVELWIAAGATMADGTTEESFQLGASLALTGGTQTGRHSNTFVDTIVATEYTLTDGEVCDSGNDRIAIYRVDLRGYKKMVMIAPTFESTTTLYACARWY